MPAETSDFADALIVIAQGKETAQAGSGVLWLRELQKEIALDMLDRDSALITSTSLNGKSDGFLHDLTRGDRLAAIRTALDHLASSKGSRRITYARFNNTRFV